MAQNIVFESQISTQGKQKVIFIPKSLNLMVEKFEDGVEVIIREKEEESK